MDNCINKLTVRSRLIKTEYEITNTQDFLAGGSTLRDACPEARLISDKGPSYTAFVDSLPTLCILSDNI